MSDLYIDFEYPPELPAERAPRCRLSLKTAGSMSFNKGAPNQTRDAFLASFGVCPERFVGIQLEHSHTLFRVDDPPSDAGYLSGDGLVTTNRNLALGVTVADCMPIFYYDPTSGSVGVLHSGWKGTGIVIEALRELERRHGTSPADVGFILGPCIGVEAYEVPEERATLFRERFGEEAARLIEGRWHISLSAANLRLLRNAGVRHIKVVDACTFRSESLGSFRREGVGFTRMLALTGYFQ